MVGCLMYARELASRAKIARDALVYSQITEEICCEEMPQVAA